MNKTAEDFNKKIERNDTYGYCLTHESINTLNELINSLLPNIHFYFNDKSYDYIWKSKDYVYTIIDNANKKYKACFGFIDKSTNEKIVLGSNWMKDHHVIFDIEQEKIGFSGQNGENLQSHREEEIQSTKVEQQLEKKDYNQLYLIIIAFLIVVIIILGIKNYKLSHQNITIQTNQTKPNEIVVELEKSPANTKKTSEYSKIKNTNDF